MPTTSGTRSCNHALIFFPLLAAAGILLMFMRRRDWTYRTYTLMAVGIIEMPHRLCR